MTVISQPEVTANILPASQSVSNAPQRILYVGQKTSTGTATSGALVLSIGNEGEEDTLFGADSILAQMVRRAKQVQGETQMDAIPLDDAAGTAATGTITIGGTTASEAGTYTVTVGSRRNYNVTVAVAITDTPTTVAAAIVTALTITGAPFTVGNVAGVVTITAANLGTVGNTFGIEVTGAVTGLTTALVAMASGATDPVLTGVLDPVDGRRYQSIIWQSNFATAEVQTELDARFNASNAVLDGEAFMTITDTLANAKITLNALNSQSLVFIVNKIESITDEYEAPAMFEFDDVVTAQFAAVRALRLTDGSNIAQYVVGAGGVNDATGGAASASMPYFNTPLTLLPLIDVGKGWSATEVEELLAAGGSVIGNNSAGNTVITGEIVTTYKTDAAANPNITWKFLNYVDTSSGAREYIFNQLKADFSQHRLTNGDLVAGRKMANAGSFRAAMKKYFQVLSGPDYVLLQAGEDALVFFSSNLTVSLDLANGTVTIGGKLPIVTQARTIIANFQIAFELS